MKNSCPFARQRSRKSKVCWARLAIISASPLPRGPSVRRNKCGRLKSEGEKTFPHLSLLLKGRSATIPQRESERYTSENFEWGQKRRRREEKRVRKLFFREVRRLDQQLLLQHTAAASASEKAKKVGRKKKRGRKTIAFSLPPPLYPCARGERVCFCV